MQKTKSNRRILLRNIIVGLISIVVILLLARYFYRQHKINRFNDVVYEYLKNIDNYQDAKNLFERDLKNKELKYFTYGMAYYKPYYKKLARKYDLEIFHMDCIIEGILSKYNFYVEEELMDYEDKESHYLTAADSIWTYFIEALDTKDYDFLTYYANNTVFISKGIFNDSSREMYAAKYLFEYYSDSLASFDYLSTKSDNWDWDSLIYCFRKIETLPSDKEPYNLRFCFIRKDSSYFFNELVML